VTPSLPRTDRSQPLALLLLLLAGCSPAPDAVEIHARSADAPAGRRLADLAEEAGYRLNGEFGYPKTGGVSVELSWARHSPSSYAARLQAVVRDRTGAQIGRTLLIEPIPERLFSPLSGDDEIGLLAGKLVVRLQRDVLAPSPRHEPDVATLEATACAEAALPAPVSDASVPVLRVDGEQGCGDACRSALLQHGYGAVEAEIVDPPEAPGGLPLYGLADRPGLWRFTVAPAGTQACAAFDRLATAETQRCIAAVPADSLTAGFSYQVRRRSRLYGWGIDAVRYETVRDTATGAVVAERERHVFQRNDVARPSGIVRCPGLDTPPLYVSVLPPARTAD
jgi:hypothetical protein